MCISLLSIFLFDICNNGIFIALSLLLLSFVYNNIRSFSLSPEYINHILQKFR